MIVEYVLCVSFAEREKPSISYSPVSFIPMANMTGSFSTVSRRRKIFPRADFQLCTIHASRNLEADVRESDKNEIDRDLKAIFLSETKDSAIDRFNQFKDKWSSKYPRSIYNLEKKLGYLFTYFQYPGSIRRSLHSSNIIERMNKDTWRTICP